MPKVTIIMPSLNVGNFIRPCMDSVLAQTLSDVEVLAIDAGSTDGTLEILEEFASRDQRVKVIHSDKKSYGYQLNMGIALATGEYVGIVETDDMIVPDMYETLYQKALETNVDYVKGTAQAFIEISKEITVKNRILCVPDVQWMGKVINPGQLPQLFVTDRFVWMGIYRQDFIKKIKLNETPGAAFQDIGFMFQAIHGATKAVYVDKDVYFYRQDNVGASSYDNKAFRYLVEEYDYVSYFLEQDNVSWCRVYYEKMMNQCLGRFRMMAFMGKFWDTMYEEMKILQTRFAEAIERQLLTEQSIRPQHWEKLQCFMISPEAVYEAYAQEYAQKKETIAKIFEMIGSQCVVIFGCGRYGTSFHALVETKCPGQAVAYCDNNSELWDKKVQGMQVMEPEKAAERHPEAIYVIANLRSAEDLKQQLKSLGIKDERICFYQETLDMLLFTT